MTSVEQKVKMPHYTARIGSIEVVALQDGLLYVPLSVIKQEKGRLEQGQIGQMLSDPMVWSNNVFLIRLDGKLILIDAGGGDLFPPESGQLIAALAGGGVRPENITDICLTHLHSDHIGGLVINGDIAFPSAKLHVSREELVYWSAAESRASAPAHHLTFFEVLEQKFLPYLKADRVNTFEKNEEIFPGLRSRLLPGHTPGLSAFTLSSGDKRIMFWGDLFNEPAQVQYPHLKLMFDWNSEMAVETRIEALELAAQENFLVAPSHAPFPGFFKIEKDALSYRLSAVVLPSHPSHFCDMESR